MMNLSEEEKGIISDGLTALMKNAGSLKAILCDVEVNEAIDAYIMKIKKLNDRVCQNMA